MRRFRFRLRLPDGRLVSVAVRSPHRSWGDAFTRACQTAESSYGIHPFAEIVCVDYTAVPADPGV